MNPGRIIWLASYPKSGNTWIRSFLKAYRSGEQALNINALDEPNAALRSVLDECLGLETTDLTLAELRSLLPEAYRAWSRRAPAALCLKTHEAYAVTAAGQPVFPADATLGVIHIVRDPRDVAVSVRHHWGITLGEAIRRLNDPGYWTARSPYPIWHVPQFLSDWSGHAQSWLNCPLPRLTLRYEDLHNAPEESFSRIVSFCGTEAEPDRVARAIAACSFERLKSQENLSGFKERLPQASEPFFRQGRVGGWRDVLTHSQAQIVVATHQETMRQLGYEI